MATEGTLSNGRIECPQCKRKGLGYAPHAHAFGWKDYGRARCRYCKKTFKVNTPPLDSKDK